ncbi:MAG: metal-sensing transcriptional repressor [Cellvibrionaceae bacterium]
MATKAENNEAMVKRLARIEGQLRGIQKLIREGSDCEKVLQQTTAARKALDKAFHEMMACMIEQDVLQSVNDEQASQQMQQIRNLLSKYS